MFEFELPKQPLRADIHRYNLQLGGFQLERAGIYSIFIEQQENSHWRSIGSLPFKVELTGNS